MTSLDAPSRQNQSSIYGPIGEWAESSVQCMVRLQVDHRLMNEDERNRPVGGISRHGLDAQSNHETSSDIKHHSLF
jgi:hypothetical protein